MCQKILRYLERTGQPQPKGKAEIYAAVLNGIAANTAKTAKNIIRILDRKFDCIYVLGGGAKSAYLCNAIKRKTGLKLYAGPVEATAMGNICTQLIRQKELLNRSEAANLLCGSTKILEF